MQISISDLVYDNNLFYFKEKHFIFQSYFLFFQMWLKQTMRGKLSREEWKMQRLRYFENRYFDCVLEITMWLGELLTNYMYLDLQQIQCELLLEYSIPETSPVT